MLDYMDSQMQIKSECDLVYTCVQIFQYNVHKILHVVLMLTMSCGFRNRLTCSDKG